MHCVHFIVYVWFFQVDCIHVCTNCFTKVSLMQVSCVASGATQYKLQYTFISGSSRFACLKYLRLFANACCMRLNAGV